MSPEYTRYTPKSERRVPRSSARKTTSPSRKPRKKKQSLGAQILALVGVLLVWPLHALFAKGTLRKKVAVGVCCVVGVMGLFAVVDWLSSRDAIHRGVQVYGVDVGGMRVREAATLINKAPVSDGTVEVSYEGESWTIPVTDLKGRLDGRAAAREAYSYTRDGTYFTQLGRRALLWVSGTEVDPPVKYDQPALKQAVDEIAREVEVKPVAASVKVVGAEPRVKAAKSGLSIDREALETLFVRATLDGTTIKEELPVDVVEPAVSTEEARRRPTRRAGTSPVT